MAAKVQVGGILVEITAAEWSAYGETTWKSELV